MSKKLKVDSPHKIIENIVGIDLDYQWNKSSFYIIFIFSIRIAWTTKALLKGYSVPTIWYQIYFPAKHYLIKKIL